MNDDLWAPVDEGPLPPPRPGPIVRTADVRGALAALDRNATAMRLGDFNPVSGRRLLSRYLSVCRSVPLAGSVAALDDARCTLLRHALAVPPGRSLADDDPTWPARVLVELLKLQVPAHSDLRAVTCGSGLDHFPDHLWYVYSPDHDVGSELRVIDYFSRAKPKSRPNGLRGFVAESYERCRCGWWFRRPVVL